MTEQIDITDLGAEINELDKVGIHIDKDKCKKGKIFFNCDINPYTPKYLTETLDLIRNIGNDFIFDGLSKTLIIDKHNFSLSQSKKK